MQNRVSLLATGLSTIPSKISPGEAKSKLVGMLSPYQSQQSDKPAQQKKSCSASDGLELKTQSPKPPKTPKPYNPETLNPKPKTHVQVAWTRTKGRVPGSSLFTDLLNTGSP